MTMQQGGPAKLDHRCIVAYAFCVIFLSGWLPAVYADKERSLEDFAEVYVDQYFEPDESLVLSGEGKKKSQALANYALGRSLEAKGRPLEAVEAYRKVLENQPDRYFLARKTAYLLARSGQQSEALEVLEENIEKNPDEPFAHIALSEYLATYQANDPDAVKRSLSVAKEAVERFPEEPAVYEHLVKVYMTGNRRGEARQVIVVEIQLHQRGELPDLRRHARQLIAFEAQHRQRHELPDLRRHARQLVVLEAQHRQRRELPDLRRHARQLIAAEVQFLQ